MTTDDLVLAVLCVGFAMVIVFWLGYLRGRHDVIKQFDRHRAMMGQGCGSQETKR